MEAETLLKQGDLEQALSSLQAGIKSDPANAKYRIFLFQLLCVMGMWDKAAVHLQVIADLDDAALAMCKSYEQVLRCEGLRQAVCAGISSPTIFGQPEPWVADYVNGFFLLIKDELEGASAAFASAQERAPVLSGSVNGKVFEWIMDGDSRFGPMLEAYINGHYYWVPFNKISKVTFERPEDLRDMVWLAAHFQWLNSGESVAFIPVRYPQTENYASNSCKLSRETQWVGKGDNVFLGMGQRTLVTERQEFALLDIEEITFRHHGLSDNPSLLEGAAT